MATKVGSLREKLLSTKGYSELGLGLNTSVTCHGEKDEELVRCRPYRFVCDRIAGLVKLVQDGFYEAMQMGRKDPRKIVFAAKMGLALTIISLLIFLKEPLDHELGHHSVWAILTVVVVFEFSIGATLSKGLNRGLGTLSAAGLALGMAELSQMVGEWEETFVIISIFIIGFIATYAKLYPTMKPYEYGFRVFLLTYCYILVSGYRTGEFMNTAVSRFVLIALGAAVCLVVNICIYPIWAGEDLHNLVAKNFMSVANSLEGCVNGYLNCLEYERVPSKILTYQASDDQVYSGYRSAVESKTQEDALVGFAVWEPPHGPYKMLKYPWKNYVKVSGALRHCAFMVMALHGCILSEIQAPADRRHVFQQELQRVGYAGAKLLRDIGNKVKKMEKLGSDDILFEVHEAAEQLQDKVDRKSYLLVNADSWEIGSREKGHGEPQEQLSLDDDENKVRDYKSLSEAVLDLRSVTMPTNWAAPNLKLGFKSALCPDGPSKFEKQISWSDRLSFDADSLPEVEKSKTYESASALSLATFTSLLIEFVARLQNVVDSFEELSEVANFKEPAGLSEAQSNGFWARLCRCLKF